MCLETISQNNFKINIYDSYIEIVFYTKPTRLIHAFPMRADFGPKLMLFRFNFSRIHATFTNTYIYIYIIFTYSHIYIYIQRKNSKT